MANKILDDTDQCIIAALQKDPRNTNKAIALEIGVSEPTVALRIQSLMDQHIMRVVAQKDLFSDRYSLMCIAFIDVLGDTDSAAAQLSQIPEMISVSRCTGSPQIFANLRARDRHDLHRIVTNVIGMIAGVARVTTSVCLKILKMEAGYGDLSSDLPRWAFEELEGRDRDICGLLLEDGRMSNREIARRLEISEGNVRQRLKKLFDSKIMQLSVVCDPIRLGQSSVALAKVAVHPSRLDAVVEHLSGRSEVPFLGAMTGDYNLWALLQMESDLMISDFVDRTILQMPGVYGCEVRQIVQNCIHRYDLVRIR